MSPTASSPRSGRGIVVLGNFVAVLAMAFATRSFHLEESFVSWGIGALLFFAVALGVGRYYTLDQKQVAIYAALGIAIGTVVDALLVESLLHLSRNLWPFDILMLWVIGLIPISAGFLLGRSWRAKIAA
jgi:hypothetical protein